MPAVWKNSTPLFKRTAVGSIAGAASVMIEPAALCTFMCEEELTRDMKLEIYKDHDELSREVARVIIAAVRNHPASVLCLAAGDTPRQVYAALASGGQVDYSGCTFIGLDEWVGIPPENEGSCSFFLHNNLFHPLGIRPHQVHLFDALAEDLVSECGKMDAIIREKGGIDLMLAGVGMNGHVGFNEPGVSDDLYAHVVTLDATTQSVGQKYFKEATRLERGITLGLKHLLESTTAIIMASSAKKAEVIRLALEGPVSNQIPASIIRKHPAGVVMLDADAGALLGKK